MNNLQSENFSFNLQSDIELRSHIEKMVWAHLIQLTDAVNTRQWYIQRRFHRRLNLLRIPDDLTGKTVLDIGAWDGFFSFECEKRGAERVLAIDIYAWDQHGMDSFLLARQLLNSKVEYRKMNIHELNAAAIGKFDVVLFFGVFYHCVNPLTALQKIAEVCHDLLICETHCLIPFVHEKYPLIPFFPAMKMPMKQIPGSFARFRHSNA